MNVCLYLFLGICQILLPQKKPQWALKNAALQKGCGWILCTGKARLSDMKAWEPFERELQDGSWGVARMVQCVSKGSVYSQVPDCRTHRTALQILSAVTGTSPTVLRQNLDSVLVGWALWLEEYSGCLFHYHSIANNYWQDIWGLVEGVMCYSGFPWSPLSPGSCGPSLMSPGWLRALNSTVPHHRPIPTVSSGILTALGNRIIRIRRFVQKHGQKKWRASSQNMSWARQRKLRKLNNQGWITAKMQE